MRTIITAKLLLRIVRRGMNDDERDALRRVLQDKLKHNPWIGRTLIENPKFPHDLVAAIEPLIEEAEACAYRRGVRDADLYRFIGFDLDKKIEEDIRNIAEERRGTR
jgi:hypothetical protein